MMPHIGRKQVELTVHFFPPKGIVTIQVAGCLIVRILSNTPTQDNGKIEACLGANGSFGCLKKDSEKEEQMGDWAVKRKENVLPNQNCLGNSVESVHQPLCLPESRWN